MIKIKKLKEKLFLILIFFLAMFPLQYKLLKIGIVGVICLLNTLFEIKINKFYLKWFVFIIFYNLFFLIEGEFLNSGILKYYIGVNFLNIVLYFFLFNWTSKTKLLEKIDKIFIYVFWISFLLFLIYYIEFNYKFFIFGRFNNIVKKIIFFKEVFKPGQYSKVSVFSYNIVTMIFLSTYMLAKSLKNIKKRRGILKFIIYNISYILLIIITLRKVMIITYLMTYILYFIITTFYNKKLKLKLNYIIYIAFLISGLSIYFLIYKDSEIFLYILKSFNYTYRNHQYGGVKERVEQAIALIEGFKNAPLLGSGIGANAAIIRSSILPGAYELTYLAMLFQRGIIGFLIYVGSILVIFKKYKKLYKYLISEKIKSYIIYYSLGTCSVLIADATNPGLDSFDFIWLVYINIFYIVLIEKSINSKIEKNVRL